RGEVRRHRGDARRHRGAVLRDRRRGGAATMSPSLLAGTILVVLGIAAGLIQLWFAPMTPETFLKVEMTIGGLLALGGVVGSPARENREDRATRSGERLD